MGGRGKVFLRDATGLTKSISLFDAIAMNISWMSVGPALALAGYTMILLPTVSGVNLVYGSIIAAILVIPQMIVYTMMSRRVSRTGGDYVWMSRPLGGFLGSTLTFMGVTAENMAYLALVTISAVFSIGSVGVALGYSNMLGLALPGNVAGADPVGQFVLSAAMYAILILINIVRPRVGIKIISVCYTIGIIGIVIAIATLLAGGTTGVENYINSLNIPNTTYASVASSYTGPTFDLNSTLLLMPYFALFTYPWFNAGASAGSELRGKAPSWNVPITLLVAFLLVTIPYAVLYYVGGFAFITGALANTNLVVNYGFNFFTLAMGVAPNFVISLIIGLSWIVLDIAVMALGIVVISRYIFAQAFDRFLPSKLAYVSETFHSPVYAHVLDLAVTVVTIALAAFFYGSFSALYGVLPSSMIYFAFVGLAAVLYAWKREKGSAKTWFFIAGALQILVFIYLTYDFLALPTIYGGNWLGYGYIVVSFVVGALIYGYRKLSQRKSGFDIDLVFKEIPPE